MAKLPWAATRSQDVFNPATGKAEKRVLAIASAQAAYPAWRNTPPLKRARVMGKLKELLEQHADECAP
jgi:malonate-semialdehyde dehydrogenase (acetylating)/methylmalonate-semialdehyde dehydrogenase